MDILTWLVLFGSGMFLVLLGVGLRSKWPCFFGVILSFWAASQFAQDGSISIGNAYSSGWFVNAQGVNTFSAFLMVAIIFSVVESYLALKVTFRL